MRGYFGILAAGGVVVPIPTLLVGGEIAALLQQSGAVALLHHESLAPVAKTASANSGVPALQIGTDTTPTGPLLPGAVPRQAEDTAVVFFTSGTTGRPKGALLTHLNLVLNATTNAIDSLELRRDDVVMGCLPLFHTFGQTVAMNATFRMGATLVLQPRFDAGAAIELMVEQNATHFCGVPTMYLALSEAAAGAERLPRLRTCVSGGAALPVAALERFESLFDATIFEGYGLSETSPTATVNQSFRGPRAGTIGHPLWGIEVEIAHAGLEDRVELLARGEVGEIVIRGHNVFAGYLDDPAATQLAMVDGWFRTGDIGQIDDEGYISIVDRKKDLIIRGGFNVYPREVEEVLATHPQVGQVAVVGLPDPVRGEEICAVVVPLPGVPAPDPDQLIAWASQRLGKHKYPRRVEVVELLPLGPSHKVLKRALRDQLIAAPLAG